MQIGLRHLGMGEVVRQNALLPQVGSALRDHPQSHILGFHQSQKLHFIFALIIPSILK
jgi:hypothetical protein